jgi:hypothetical protein
LTKRNKLFIPNEILIRGIGRYNYLAKKVCAHVVLAVFFLGVFFGGTSYSYNKEKIPQLLGKWQGKRSLSVAETGFTSLSGHLILNIYEQSGRYFKGMIEGTIDGTKYGQDLTGSIDENDKYLCAATSDGNLYIGYFITDSFIRFYSFEKKANARIIQYKLKKIQNKQ